MNLHKYKLIFTSLLLVLLVGSIGLYFKVQNSKTISLEDIYSIVPSSVEAIYEVHSIDNLIPYYNRLSGDVENVSLVHDFIQVKPSLLNKNQPFLLTYSKKGLQGNGEVLLFPFLNIFNEWLDTYLKKYAVLSSPPKSFVYKGVELFIYPLKSGKFITLVTLNNIHIISYEKCLIESIVDVYLGASSLLDSSFKASYSLLKNEEVNAVIYAKSNYFTEGRENSISNNTSSEEVWQRFNLIVDDSVFYCLTELDVESSHYYTLQEYSENTIKDTIQLPQDAFSINRWSESQIKEQLLHAEEDTIISSREQEWNSCFGDFLLDAMSDGLWGVRIQDTIVSSEVILRLPLSSFEFVQSSMTKLKQNQRLIIKSLLREESLYNHWGTEALPAPLFLNLLTETSRDLRVIYLSYYKNNLFISWDYTLLARYLQDLKLSTPVNTHIKLSEEIINTPYSFFSANLGVVAQDTLTNYPQIPSVILNQVDRFKDYYWSRELNNFNNKLIQITALKKIP